MPPGALPPRLPLREVILEAVDRLLAPLDRAELLHLLERRGRLAHHPHHEPGLAAFVAELSNTNSCGASSNRVMTISRSAVADAKASMLPLVAGMS